MGRMGGRPQTYVRSSRVLANALNLQEQTLEAARRSGSVCELAVRSQYRLGTKALGDYCPI
jgi:hypothetical protein